MGARGIVRMSASRMGDRVLVDRSVAGVVHVWMGCADRIRARVMGISAALEHVMQTELETVRARAGNLVARRGVRPRKSVTTTLTMTVIAKLTVLMKIVLTEVSAIPIGGAWNYHVIQRSPVPALLLPAPAPAV